MKFILRTVALIFGLAVGSHSAFGSVTFFPPSGYPGMPTYVMIDVSGGGLLAAYQQLIPIYVDFNGVYVATGNVVSDTQIQVIVPAGATTGRISVQVGNGTVPQSSVQDFVIGPFIGGFTPVSGLAGTTLVTIFGAQFSEGSLPVVKFNGTNASPVTVTGDTQIQVTVPANAMTGPISLAVATGPNKGTNITTTNFFVQPVITNFFPAAAQAGSNITLSGRSFAGLTAVLIGNVNATIVSSSQTNIVFTVPNNAATGKIRVDAPPNSTTTISNFIVLPTILGFSPPKGNVGTNVIITGLSFVPVAGSANVVKFNGIQANIIGTPSSTSITSTVPSGATSGLISVTTSNGTAFSVTNFYLPPSISNLAPTTGGAGTLVTITGQNLTNTTAVTFNGVAAGLFTNIDNTRIDVVAPSGSGTGPVVVTTPGGSATNSSVFYYPPAITSFNPGSGLSGQLVTVLGVNLTNASSVKFAGTNAPGYAVVTDGKITVTVPPKAVSGPITIVTPGGTAVSPAWFFVDTASLSVLLSNNFIFVTWPTNTTGFTLESTTNLLSTNTVWLSVTNPPITLQNGRNTYTNLLDSAGRYFRLKK